MGTGTETDSSLQGGHIAQKVTKWILNSKDWIKSSRWEKPRSRRPLQNAAKTRSRGTATDRTTDHKSPGGQLRRRTCFLTTVQRPRKHTCSSSSHQQSRRKWQKPSTEEWFERLRKCTTHHVDVNVFFLCRPHVTGYSGH